MEQMVSRNILSKLESVKDSFISHFNIFKYHFKQISQKTKCNKIVLFSRDTRKRV